MFAVPQQARAAELDSLEAREGEAQLPKGAFLIPSQVCGTKCNNKMTPKQQDYQDLRPGPGRGLPTCKGVGLGSHGQTLAHAV